MIILRTCLPPFHQTMTGLFGFVPFTSQSKVYDLPDEKLMAAAVDFDDDELLDLDGVIVGMRNSALEGCTERKKGRKW